MSNITQQYDTTAKYLHWISAMIILWATLSGLYIAFFGLETQLLTAILNFNVSITTVFIPLFIWRIYHRVKCTAPQADPKMSALEIKLAHYGHTALYVLVSVVLVSGVLMMGHDVTIFHLFILPQTINDPSSLHFFEAVHLYACRLLAVLVFVHIAALIKHEFMGRRVLKRMV